MTVDEMIVRVAREWHPETCLYRWRLSRGDKSIDVIEAENLAWAPFMERLAAAYRELVESV